MKGNIFGGRILDLTFEEDRTPIRSKEIITILTSERDPGKRSGTMATCIRDRRKKARQIFMDNKENNLYMILGVDSKAT